MRDTLENIRKEAVVARVKSLSMYLSVGTEESHANSQDILQIEIKIQDFVSTNRES
jgi:hypothetical protein